MYNDAHSTTKTGFFMSPTNFFEKISVYILPSIFLSYLFHCKMSHFFKNSVCLESVTFHQTRKFSLFLISVSYMSFYEKTCKFQNWLLFSKLWIVTWIIYSNKVALWSFFFLLEYTWQSYLLVINPLALKMIYFRVLERKEI